MLERIDKLAAAAAANQRPRIANESSATASCSKEALAEAEYAYSAGKRFALSCDAPQTLHAEQAKRYAILMDKVAVKAHVQRWLPDLRVAPTLAVVRNASAISDALLAGMPRELCIAA